MGYKIIKDKIAVATNPLYKAFITFLDCPSFTKKEPIMDVNNVAKAVYDIAELPLNTNIQFMTIMASSMPYIGRG